MLERLDAGIDVALTRNGVIESAIVLTLLVIVTWKRDGLAPPPFKAPLISPILKAIF